MVDVNLRPFGIKGRACDDETVGTHVYLPTGVDGPLPVLPGASTSRKAPRDLPVCGPVLPPVRQGTIQLYLDHGHANVAMDTPAAAGGATVEVRSSPSKARRSTT